MQNIGAGAGSSGTGGGTSGTGGGTANAGGTAGTAGGTAGTAGGTSGTGGGTATTGGGSSGTGGGSSGTGGGTSGTGGGSASSTVFCNRLLAAQTRFFAGRSSCPGGAITLTPGFNASACAATWNVCNDADRGYLNQIAMCLESAQVCTTGNESAASAGFLQCLSLSEALSDACAASLQSP